METLGKGICVPVSAALMSAIIVAAVASGHPGHALSHDWRGHGHDWGHGAGHGHVYGDSQGYGGGHGNGHTYGHHRHGNRHTYGHHRHGNGHTYGHHRHGNGHAYGHHRHGHGHGHGHGHEHSNSRTTSAFAGHGNSGGHGCSTCGHRRGSSSQPSGLIGTKPSPSGGGSPSAPRLPSIVSATLSTPSSIRTSKPSHSTTVSSQPLSPGTGVLTIPRGGSASSLLGARSGAGRTGRVPSLFAVPLRTGLAARVSPVAAPATRGTNSAARASSRAAGGSDATASGGKPLPVKPRLQQPSAIERIERVIPGFVWLAIGISLVLAAVGGAATLWSGRRVRRQAGQFAAVSAAAMTDPLTGVLNRRGFTEAAERELARARRYERPFVLAYVDVRGLKAVNDSEGHLAGDELLKEAAHLLRTTARAADVVGRIGGDEMALLLAEQTTAGAIPVVDRISSQVAVRRAEMGLRAPWDLTIGTATYPDDGETVTDLLGAADRRLYEQRGIAL
jgi:diguanylate cyclase (GGDEF)-like protein